MHLVCNQFRGDWMSRSTSFAAISLAVLILISDAAYPQNPGSEKSKWVTQKPQNLTVNSDPATLTTVLVPRSGAPKLQQTDMTQKMNLIVEFKEEPMFVRQLRQGSAITDRSTYESRLAQFRSDIVALRASGFKGLKVPLSNPVVSREYTKVFFGAAITVPRAMLSQIAGLSYVKRVFIDRPVKALLEQSVHQIRADSVWSIFGTKGDGIVVGTEDTGIDYGDSALGGGFGPGYKVVGGYNFIANNNDPMDDNGHGTHVAGIIAADGGGFEGVAPHAKLMAFKVLNSAGAGLESTVIAGVERAADPNDDGNDSDRVDVLNISLGGSGSPDDPLCTAVDNIVDLGVSVCAAAGNSGNFFTIGSPAAAPLAITVGAVDSSDNLASFSSKGPNPLIYSIKPEVVAPGVSVLSTYLNNSSATFSGTSMATPFVSGVCALLKSLHRSWTPYTLKSAVVNSAVDIGDEAMAAGAGRVDAFNAARTSTFAVPCDLSFGLDSSSSQTWTEGDTLWISNANSETQTYTFSFDNVPSGVSLSVNPSTLSLAGNTMQSVVVTLDVDNSVVPFPSQGSCTYSGNCVLAGTEDTIRLPWAFVKLARVLLSFDQPEPMFILTSKFSAFSNGDATWLGEYTAQLDIPKGEYDLLAFYQSLTVDKVVIDENTMLGDVTQVPLLSSSATNLINLDGVDENGERLSNYPSLMKNFSIGFPDSSISLGMLVIGQPDSILFSNVSQRFSLWCGEFASNGLNSVYSIQFGSISGIDRGQDLTNLPSELYSETVHAGFPPFVDGMYKRMDYVGWNLITIPGFGMFGIGEQLPINGGFNGDWSGTLHLTKSRAGPFTFPASLSALYGPEQFAASTLFEYEWFDTPTAQVYHDSVGFYWLDTPSAATFLVPNAGSITLGHALMYPDVSTSNNELGKSNILAFAEFFGASGEYFRNFPDSSTYKIFDAENNVVASDTESNFPGYGINVAPGRYSYQLTNRDYFIRGVRGTDTLTCRFDLSKPDANSPGLTSMRLLNASGMPTDSLSVGERGTLVFSAADDNALDADSTRLFYKLDEAGDWVRITVSETREDSSDGTGYVADMGATSLVDSASVDLKIDLLDRSGNSTEWLMEPAYCVGNFGVPTSVDVNPGTGQLPKAFSLFQNYPNPFNPTTTIHYDLPKTSRVTLQIYDVLGRKVATLVKEIEMAGKYTTSFDGSRLATGVYFYRLTAGDFVSTKKMLLVK